VAHNKADFLNLPDWAILNDDEAARAIGVSKDTLQRLDRAGEGPAITRMSPRRRGRTVGAIKSWIGERTIAPCAEKA